ncbi:cell wall / vacuolar inhibitor of fructosidase 2-like [Panicum miliaceum]|uniref:Cell wall / vacuolar inhibitor of fructosidase 2-like n=1 Tax=Panicum miliaceum TaxID=4540 RepID=A0A3L6SP97_PANMI|nr:cell wall / vacuolar inhibitor of fructosidase 2-like [Panicum miliaceum]
MRISSPLGFFLSRPSPVGRYGHTAAPAMATAASPLLVLLLIQLHVLFHLSDSSIALAQPQHSSGSKERHQPALLQSTCNSTSFYDVCIAALAADPSSSTADVPGLCAIAVSAAAANASGTATFLANASDAAATPETDRALLRTCAAKYAAARDALLAARASLAAQDYDYAFVHASAAAEYPAVCRTLFRRRQQRPSASRTTATYPPELAKREEALRRLCTITLDIISLLQTQEPST